MFTTKSSRKIMWRLRGRLVDWLVDRLYGRVATTLSTSVGPLRSV
jgi:hypothetical protein